MPDSSRLTVRFWGVRGSTPTPEARCMSVGGNTSCVEIRTAEGDSLILDAGTGIRSLGYALAAEAAGAPISVDVLFSHFHWDHLQGLPFFAPLYGGGNEIRFIAAVDDARLDRLLQGQMCSPYFPVPFSELAASVETHRAAVGETFEVGGCTVRAFPVSHPQGAHGFRIEHEGVSVVYATDYEHGDPVADEGLREVARGADVLISDAQFTPDEYEIRKGWGHTTWEHATQLAADAGVGQLILFHHDPAHDDDALERIRDQARERFAATELAIEGMEIRL
ncbi:MAG: MBL fold metallo-hydrolase [Rubricoccaceae bacterium]